MTLEEAITWCQDHQVTLSFGQHPRTGAPAIELYSHGARLRDWDPAKSDAERLRRLITKEAERE